MLIGIFCYRSLANLSQSVNIKCLLSQIFYSYFVSFGESVTLIISRFFSSQSVNNVPCCLTGLWLLSGLCLQREQETTDLKRNIDRLYDQNRDLKNRVKHPRGRRTPHCPADNRVYYKSSNTVLETILLLIVKQPVLTCLFHNDDAFPDVVSQWRPS